MAILYIQILFILSLLVRHILTGIIRRGVISREFVVPDKLEERQDYTPFRASIRDLMYG